MDRQTVAIPPAPPAWRPPIRFPEELPVSALRHEIGRAILEHQTVVVCGETGSGKTTQLPKICLDIGRGTRGRIGHTQPRRIAARATAARIAHELGSDGPRLVGWKVRFTDRTGPEARIKLMTDGILLAETQGDPLLRQYDTLIVDEAHERSLNIDFLLGYLVRVLAQRPELKLIVTSATLDAGRFARHFAGKHGPAPVIEVSGRLHPIELRYRLPAEGTGLDEAIVDAVDEAAGCGPGDVLVFLPGEREIREAAEALRKRHFAGPRGIEVLPLFARQSAAEQARVFQPSNGRRVVLATNVAETSLTVPGVRYVVDTGLARVKRYSPRSKVEQLQIEPVSQAASRQRAGRCGRVAAGICFRLYEEQDLARRPAYTDPEILRSSLAGVILRMKALGLGPVEEFPFLDKPSPRGIADGYQLLAELGAVDEARELTSVGAELARLPLDPKVGRMILAARDRGALKEVLSIAAALSVQDPRERPAEQPGAADAARARWNDERSEFLAFLKLWDEIDRVWSHASNARQRAWCRANFVSYPRVREWRDVHGQLRVLATEHGWRENERPAGFEAIHKSLLAGLLGNIGLRGEDTANYLGARGIRFWPHPGSALAKKAGRWVMAAELVETTRLYARCLARIEPEWVEEVGAHLVRRSTYDPHWEKKPARVTAWERGVIHGLTLYARRAVAYGRIDPAACRAIFIRQALVGGQFETRAPFLRHNRALVSEIEQLEHRSRRPDVLVDEALIHAFYDAILPAEVIDGASFECWRKRVEAERPRLLFLERDQLMRHQAAGITTDRFPNAFEILGRRLELCYHFEPGAADDGVTLAVPLEMLNQVPAARCEWLVPGMLEEKVLQLAKTLPQKVRHRIGQPAAFAAEFAEAEHDREEPLSRALHRAVEQRAQMKLPAEAFRPENLPAHLSMNFRVLDEHGRILGQSRNLAELRCRLDAQVERSFRGARAAGEESSGLTDWGFGALPERVESSAASGQAVVGFPGLVDEGRTVALRVFDTPEKAASAHRSGLRRLFALSLKEPLRHVLKGLPRELALAFLPLGGEVALHEQLTAASVERACMDEPLPRERAAFHARREQARPRVALVAQEIARLASAILDRHASLQKKLAQIKAFPEAAADVRGQLARLVRREFLAATPYERLQHYPRYLEAAALRLEKLRADPARDARLMQEHAALARPFERERAARAKAGVTDPSLEEFGWLLEELRVALFAQELRTPAPVSVKRLRKIWEARGR